MTLAQLASFERIVELRSFSKAAAVLRIAQPALSRTVRALELELEARLLVRHRWGVDPTPAGQVLLEHARRLRNDVESAKGAVHALAAEPAGLVVVGVPASLAAAILPSLAAALMLRHPKLRLHFVDSFSADLHSKTVAAELDLSILYRDGKVGPLVVTPLLHESLVWVIPAGTAERARAALPLILPARPNRLRLIVEEAFAASGCQPWIEADSLPAIIAMIAQGQGRSILPFSAVRSQVELGLVEVVNIAPPMSRTLVLARPQQRSPTPAILAVEEEIGSLVHALATEMRWHPLINE
jgi:LysR family nitrogen assimilation transcriptional regulator